jgi:mannosyltransferase OCH1-like enzyme
MSTIKIPRNPCAMKKKTLKQLRNKIFKHNDTRKKFIKTTSEAKKIVEKEAEKSISFIKQLIITKKNKPKVIPMHIVQVWHDKSKLPVSVNDSINLIKKQNPEFKHTLFDESECRDFIKTNYQVEVLNAYDKIIPHALKADLWRYCYMYKNGGIYLDAKYYCTNGFKLHLLTDKEYFCRDILQSFSGIYNAILICKPKNKIMHKCINTVVKNIQHNYYGSDGLCSTGPLMIASFFTKKQIDGLILNHEMLNDNIRFIRYKEYRILQYHEHYKKEKNQKHKHWSKYWEGGKLYNE